MEIIQYNGFHGCPFCDSAGETVKTGENASTHVYPFNISQQTEHKQGSSLALYYYA